MAKNRLHVNILANEVAKRIERSIPWRIGHIKNVGKLGDGSGKEDESQSYNIIRSASVHMSSYFFLFLTTSLALTRHV